MQGYMKRTPRGREITELGYKCVGAVMPGNQQTLF
jgi:Holliday junction resolvasome RuvABC ATP-dependent DNA helicase subunit